MSLPEPQWGVDDVAEHRGVQPSTVRSYLARNQIPAPDGKIGGTPWWWRSTITGSGHDEVLVWRWAEDDELDEEPATFPTQNANLWHMHVALSALGAARVLRDRTQGALARLRHRRRSVVEYNVTTQEMANSIQQAAKLMAADDLGRLDEFGGKMVPTLAASWPAMPQTSLKQARRVREDRLPRVSQLSRDVLQGIGEPCQVWEPQTKNRVAGKSVLDVSDSLRGDEIVTKTFVPAIEAVAAMDEEEIIELWRDPFAGDTKPYTRLRWIGRFGEGVNAVHTFLSVVGLAAFPVQMHVGWNNQDGSTGVLFRTPGTSMSRGKAFAGEVWAAVPLPTETPVLCDDWLRAAGSDAVVPHLEEHLQAADEMSDARRDALELVGGSVAWAALKERYRWQPGLSTLTTDDSFDAQAWTWIIGFRQGLSNGPHTSYSWQVESSICTVGFPQSAWRKGTQFDWT